MTKPYGISGTPWHVERIHNENPDDSRRHRSRCAYYDKESKHCRKQYGMCVGASHCKIYREKRADTVVADESDKIVTSNVASFKYDKSGHLPASALKDIKIGTFVVVESHRYIVLKKIADRNGSDSYICQRVIIIPGVSNPRSNRRWIFKDYFIASTEKFTFHNKDISRVEPPIPEKFIEDFIRRKQKPVKPIRNAMIPSKRRMPDSVAAAVSTPVKQEIPVKKENVLDNRKQLQVSLNQYRIVAYEGKLKQVVQKELFPMNFISKNGKHVLVSVDMGDHILYMTKALYCKYLDELRALQIITLYPA